MDAHGGEQVDETQCSACACRVAEERVHHRLPDSGATASGFEYRAAYVAVFSDICD